jgi:hypothetical protein
MRLFYLQPNECWYLVFEVEVLKLIAKIFFIQANVNEAKIFE